MIRDAILFAIITMIGAARSAAAATGILIKTKRGTSIAPSREALFMRSPFSLAITDRLLMLPGLLVITMTRLFGLAFFSLSLFLSFAIHHQPPLMHRETGLVYLLLRHAFSFSFSVIKEIRVYPHGGPFAYQSIRQLSMRSLYHHIVKTHKHSTRPSASSKSKPYFRYVHIHALLMLK